MQDVRCTECKPRHIPDSLSKPDTCVISSESITCHSSQLCLPHSPLTASLSAGGSVPAEGQQENCCRSNDRNVPCPSRLPLLHHQRVRPPAAALLCHVCPVVSCCIDAEIARPPSGRAAVWLLAGSCCSCKYSMHAGPHFLQTKQMMPLVVGNAIASSTAFLSLHRRKASV